ncbi:TrkA family potassium uptake protein [candidate division WOR-3 bacterium]|nr:TrkA family potassium uptake protein [candidate division WOR-3 bacterium]
MKLIYLAIRIDAMDNAGNYKYFGVIGIGRFGFSIAESLVRNGARVIALDKSEESLTPLQNLAEAVVIGDATDQKTLMESGFQYTDIVIVSFAQELATSILTTMLLKEIGVKKIIAKARNFTHEKILKKIGADEVVLPEIDSGRRLANKLSSPGFQEIIEFTPGYSIVDVRTPKSFIGKTIKELGLRNNYNVNVLAVKKPDKSTNISPDPETVFDKNDTVTLLGKDEDLQSFSRI